MTREDWEETNRMIEQGRTHGWLRQCSIGWHEECSVRRGYIDESACACPCHKLTDAQFHTWYMEGLI